MKQIIEKIDHIRSWPERKRMLAAAGTMIITSGIVAMVWFSAVFPNKQLAELNIASVSQPQPATSPTDVLGDMTIPGPAAGLMESFQGIGNLLKKEAEGARHNSYDFFYDIPLRIQRTIQYITDAIRSEVAQYAPMGRIIISYYQERIHAITQRLHAVIRYIQQLFGR